MKTFLFLKIPILFDCRSNFLNIYLACFVGNLDISQVIFVCLMLYLLCVHCVMPHNFELEIITFPVLISHVYFWFLAITGFAFVLIFFVYMIANLIQFFGFSWLDLVSCFVFGFGNAALGTFILYDQCTLEKSFNCYTLKLTK